MVYENVQLELRGAIGLLTLNRPESLNALTVEMAEDFMAAVREAQDGGARAIVVTGQGRAFSAGGDIKQMQEIAAKEGKPEAFFDEPLRLLHDMVLMIYRGTLPFIAAVNGVASGAGCNLALACDLLVAGASARFNQAFIKIGLSPDCGGTFILPRLIGWKRAAQLLFTGEMIDAQQALEMGMVNSVVADGELMTRSLSLAEQLAKAPTAAIAKTKMLLDASAANDYETQLELERMAQMESGRTRDFREGVAAFFEKRPARFEGG
jgi:2-(1,2-epoxy-1,2-dihydrophenyl)acetyl-CoA isomerase